MGGMKDTIQPSTPDPFRSSLNFAVPSFELVRSYSACPDLPKVLKPGTIYTYNICIETFYAIILRSMYGALVGVNRIANKSRIFIEPYLLMISE